MAPLLEMLGKWDDFLSRGLSYEEVEKFRCHERTGRPLGTDSFIARLENELGKILHKQKPGPKVSPEFLGVEYDGKLCHLSCGGYSYSIRYFRDGNFVEIDRGKNDKEKYLALKSQIETVGKAPAKPIEDTEYWRNYFTSMQEDNKQCW